MAETAPVVYREAYDAWKEAQAGMAKLLVGHTANLAGHAIDPLEIEKLIISVQHNLDVAAPMEIILSRYQASRCFCVTEKGYIGWTALGAREGDLIVALWGTRLLFTLKPTEGGFTLTGDCYLQGLMEGEGLRIDDLVDNDIVIV